MDANEELDQWLREAGYPPNDPLGTVSYEQIRKAAQDLRRTLSRGSVRLSIEERARLATFRRWYERKNLISLEKRRDEGLDPPVATR